MTPGPWRAGSSGKYTGSVVADSEIATHSAPSEIDSYGGCLVAESILSQANVAVIAQAPSMAVAIIETLPLVEGEIRKRLEESLGQLALLDDEGRRAFLGLPPSAKKGGA